MVIQKIGKKMMIATTHPIIPKIRAPCFFISAAFEIFREHLDQEVSHDVCQNDCQNAAGGTGADIKSLNTQGVDKKGEVFAGMPWTTRSCGVNLGENG